MNDAPNSPRRERRPLVMPRRPTTWEDHAAWIVSGHLVDTVAEGGGGFRLGVLCDSGESMDGFGDATASLAWVMMYAAHRAALRFDRASGVTRSATTAAVQTEPGVLPCLEMPGMGISHQIGSISLSPTCQQSPRLDHGVQALRNRVRLGEEGVCRLLVMITDARAPQTVLDQTRTGLDDLRATGCGVLWLCPATAPCLGATFPGTTLVIDPGNHLVPGVLGEVMDAEIRCPQPDHADRAADRGGPAAGEG